MALQFEVLFDQNTRERFTLWLHKAVDHLNHGSITRAVFSPVSLEELPASFIRVLLGTLALSLERSGRIRRLYL